MIEAITLTSDQEFKWNQSKNEWYFLGEYLDYCQLKQAGYLPKDPLAGLPPSYAESLKIEGNFLLAQLELIINGWDLIKEAAANQGREFNFNCPRLLFTELCRQEAMDELKFTLSNGYNLGDGTEETRKYFRDLSKFYRDRMSEDEYAFWLHTHQSCEYWSRFIIFAVWEQRHSKLKKVWKNYLYAHKQRVKMICDKNFYDQWGVKAITLKWSNGKAFDSKNGSRIKLLSIKGNC
jgi:hypothetical protein